MFIHHAYENCHSLLACFSFILLLLIHPITVTWCFCVAYMLYWFLAFHHLLFFPLPFPDMIAAVCGSLFKCVHPSPLLAFVLIHSSTELFNFRYREGAVKAFHLILLKISIYLPEVALFLLSVNIFPPNAIDSG